MTISMMMISTPSLYRLLEFVQKQTFTLKVAVTQNKAPPRLAAGGDASEQTDI